MGKSIKKAGAAEKNVGIFRIGAVFLISLAILAVLSVIALRIGSVSYSTSEILESIFDTNSTIHTIIINLRLPRVILAILVGMCLAAAGTLLQAVMQNPLADPGIIGVLLRCQCGGHDCISCSPHPDELTAIAGLWRRGGSLPDDLYHGMEAGD